MMNGFFVGKLQRMCKKHRGSLAFRQSILYNKCIGGPARPFPF